MDQCCAPNSHKARHISDHPPKRHFNWESGKAIHTTYKFDILRSQMLLHPKRQFSGPTQIQHIRGPLWPRLSSYYLRKKKNVTVQSKDRGLGVSPEELSCAGRQKQRFAHRPKQMFSATHVVFAEHQVQIGTSWIGISCELTRQKNYSWPRITSAFWRCKHAFSSTTCGSEENHLKIDQQHNIE